MVNLSGESREQNRKGKVTKFRSVTYARQLWLLVNTLWSHLKNHVVMFCFGLQSIARFKKNQHERALLQHTQVGG